MVVDVAGDALLRDGPEARQEFASHHHQGREDLLQDVAVVPDQEPQVLAEVVADQLDLQAPVIELLLQRPGWRVGNRRSALRSR